MAQSPHPSKPRPAAARRPTVDQAPRDSRTSDGSPAEATILLVDDDKAVRESLQRVLATEGWRVISAASGEEALEFLAAHQPDLMITDLCMAEVNGWDLLFHENLQRPKLPIFIVTALPLPAVGGADRFAAEFFQKPLDLDALVLAIHRCLTSRRSLRAQC